MLHGHMNVKKEYITSAPARVIIVTTKYCKFKLFL
jgi:hypothetical protein